MGVLAEQKIEPIDLVVCTLPFEATLAKPGSTHEDIVENVDIGGPSMVRAACKNYHDVAIVVDPSQYAAVADELKANSGATTLELREKLVAAAFARTASYDAAIAGYFASRQTSTGEHPERLDLSFRKKQSLRYGENPHQKAAFYVEPNVRHACVATAEVLHGKELSYNNILDLDSSLNLVREYAEPAAVVIKHNKSLRRRGGCVARRCVSKSVRRRSDRAAFGGILGFNREVDEATAMQITEPKRFIECIIAPDYSPEAAEDPHDSAHLEEQRSSAANRSTATRLRPLARFSPRGWRVIGAGAR
ncbi:MAG: hypothetical protein U0744_04240 [Gemmataceae bacterium]